MWLIFQKLSIGFFKLGTQKIKEKKWLIGLLLFVLAFFLLFLSFKRI